MAHISRNVISRGFILLYIGVALANCLHAQLSQVNFSGPVLLTLPLCHMTYGAVGYPPDVGSFFEWPERPYYASNFSNVVDLYLWPNQSDTILSDTLLVSRKTIQGELFLDTLVFLFNRPLPKAPLRIDLPQSVCPGDTVWLETNRMDSTYTYSGLIVLRPFTSTSDTSLYFIVQGPELVVVQAYDEFSCPYLPDTISIATVGNISPFLTTAGPVGPFCNFSSPQVVPVSPTGGSLSGAGVIGNLFHPQLSGLGLIPVTYRIDTLGCIYEAQTLVEVFSIPPVNVQAIAPLCQNAPPLPLLPLVSNGLGQFSGSGVSDNMLQPSALAPGLHAIHYVIDLGDGCINMDSIYFFIKPLPLKPEIVTSTGRDRFCEGDSIKLGVQPFTQIAWNTGSSETHIWVSASGLYTATYTNLVGCQNSDSIEIFALPPLQIELSSPLYNNGYHVSQHMGSDGSINGEVLNGTAPYAWLWNALYYQNPPLQGLPAGTYTVYVTDLYGCEGRDTIVLTMPDKPTEPPPPNPEPDMQVLLPNSFTPNGDGFNDTYIIYGLSALAQPRLSIFNRWGQLVQQYPAYNNQWSGNNSQGQALPDATYFVVLEAENLKEPLRSFVQLMR